MIKLFNKSKENKERKTKVLVAIREYLMINRGPGFLAVV
jgi:hypothetical protein